MCIRRLLARDMRFVRSGRWHVDLLLWVLLGLCSWTAKEPCEATNDAFEEAHGQSRVACVVEVVVQVVVVDEQGLLYREVSRGSA